MSRDAETKDTTPEEDLAALEAEIQEFLNRQKTKVRG